MQTGDGQPRHRSTSGGAARSTGTGPYTLLGHRRPRMAALSAGLVGDVRERTMYAAGALVGGGARAPALVGPRPAGDRGPAPPAARRSTTSLRTVHRLRAHLAQPVLRHLRRHRLLRRRASCCPSALRARRPVRAPPSPWRAPSPAGCRRPSPDQLGRLRRAVRPATPPSPCSSPTSATAGGRADPAPDRDHRRTGTHQHPPGAGPRRERRPARPTPRSRHGRPASPTSGAGSPPRSTTPSRRA